MRRLAVLILVLLIGALLESAPAAAAPYVVHGCTTPDGSPAPVDGWAPEASQDSESSFLEDRCASGGGLVGSIVAGEKSGKSVRWRFTAPPDTAVSGFTVWRSAEVGASGNAAAGQYRLDAAGVQEACGAGDGCEGFGDPAKGGRDPSNALTRTGLTGATDVALAATCVDTFGDPDARCGQDPNGREPASFRLVASEITLQDTQAPVFASRPGGGLAQPSGPLNGEQFVTYSVTDKGGGIASATLEIDGQIVARQNPGECAVPYVRTVPCKAAASGGLGFDTRRVSDGFHRVRLLVADATGTNTAVFGPVGIEVRNEGSSGPSPSPSPIPSPSPLPPSSPQSSPSCLTGVAPRVSTRLPRSTVSFGSRARYAGRVTDSARRGVAGATVQVLRGSRIVATARTTRSGRFSLRLAPGTTRTVRAAVPVAGGLACSTVRRLKVRAGGSLAASRRSARVGQTISFSGRIRGRSFPRGGKLVVLQARDRDGRWRPVRNVRTSRTGRYRTSYRFSASRGRFTFRFRVQIPRERGFPYVLGFSPSRPVTITRR